MPHKIPQQCIDLVKEFEGLSLSVYKDEAGHATIGYGHKIIPGERFLGNIKERFALQLLEMDLEKHAEDMMRLVKVALNDNQFSALLSFVFHFGATKFRNSTLLKKLNDKDYAGAAEELLRWKFVKGKESNGLVRRRKAERELFLKPIEGECK